MALRQTTGFAGSLLRLIGMDWAVPDFGTLSRRQKTLKVNIPYRGSDGPLHLLVDSAGIKVEGEGEWNARKHGGTKRRVWRKIHIRCPATDGAFDTRKCHDAISARGAVAIIPPRTNAKPWKPDTAGAVARNETLRTSKRVGRTIWRPLSADGYAIACRAMDGAAITAEAVQRPKCTA